MHIRFLPGPAGSGKTFRCLAEIRDALRADADGPPLILLAPRQATFQLERQLLSDSRLTGYTRLQILSFERLAGFVFDRLRKPRPQILTEEGRIMVLRGLLAKRRDELKLFRASARLNGFARQLSLTLRELQRHQLTPDDLERIAAAAPQTDGLPLKLRDCATLLRHYLDWLAAHQLQDADSLLDAATAALNSQPSTLNSQLSLWLDGFAELSPQELDLLAAVVARCERATLAFCLDPAPKEKSSWLSHWSLVRRTVDECRKRLEKLPGAAVSIEPLKRDPRQNRFQACAALQHLEENWAGAAPFTQLSTLNPQLNLFACPDAEAEATLAAREILRFVRAGGRFREAAVLVRKLDDYFEPLQRVFSRYEIPCFLDRREPVAHHPLAELTRGALRTAAFQWAHDDWFAALKTGLVPDGEDEGAASLHAGGIDRLENEALARGWKGVAWLQPIQIPDDPALAARLEQIRQRIVPPFQNLAHRLAAQQNRPTGPLLAEAVRGFWSELDVATQLERWADAALEKDPSAAGHQPAAVHATVRDQMNEWLDNVALAFPDATLSLREWLPVLDAGLAHLTVGVVPPALDQVLVGAVDRSRNPDLRFALVLGLNETVFPASPDEPALLSDSDREELGRHGVALQSTLRERAARERYLGYIACTRASEKLTLTFARQDANGRPLNPSPFIPQLQRLFPWLAPEEFHTDLGWPDTEHLNELAPLLAQTPIFHLPSPISPRLARLAEDLRRLRSPDPRERLSPAVADALYGPVLRTSVSRLEEFAACPFRFFVHSGLRADERKLFELDAREQGTFQHDALKLFHEQLVADHKRWRDLTPAEARERMGTIAAALTAGFRDGLMRDSARSRFASRLLGQSLQDFIEVIVSWMRGQYEFDPAAVELEFGREPGSAQCELSLGDGRKLALQGRIDRVDLWRSPDGADALGVVVDYKSGHKTLNKAFLEHGVQLQLPAYLNVLRRWTDPRPLGAARIRPAGVFYVNLHGKHEVESSRNRVLERLAEARRTAYRHTGRFDAAALPLLDRIGARDQFNYRLKQDGTLHGSSSEAMTTADFQRLLDHVETLLVEMGRRIFDGDAGVDPYRRGAQTPCDFCDYRSICRIDPWTHRYRSLTGAPAAGGGAGAARGVVAPDGGASDPDLIVAENKNEPD